MELAVQLLAPVQLQAQERLLEKLPKEGRPTEHLEQLQEMLPSVQPRELIEIFMETTL